MLIGSSPAITETNTLPGARHVECYESIPEHSTGSYRKVSYEQSLGGEA
jgi:hypothetical protein